MASHRRQHEVPFILDGKTITIGITKNTTCSDVIKKLQNAQRPLAVFMCVDGVDKELSGKTKLLKIWRINESTGKFQFVVRKSQLLSKAKKTSKKLHSGQKNSKQLRSEMATGNELSKHTLKQVSDLAFYIRYQKTKIQALEQNSENIAVTSEQNRLMRGMTSNASVNSMDAFLAKVDLNEMAKFLTFCGEVTAEKLGKGQQKSQVTDSGSRETKPPTGKSKNNKHGIRESLKSSKLALKQKFVSKKTVDRTLSTGTIGSTDTGYHSVGSECERFSKTSSASIVKPHSLTRILIDSTDEPRHSTPLHEVRTHKRRAEEIETTFNADTTIIPDNLDQLNEIHGKSMILQKFMADQTLPVYGKYTRNEEFNSPDVTRRCIGRYSMPATTSQTKVCHSLLDENCELDFDYENDIFESCEALDIAFNAGVIDFNSTLNCQSRKLRRESAISNLKRFSLVSPGFDADPKENFAPQTRILRRESAISNLNHFSLPSHDIGLETFDESSGFDYSFDCSFPRMDETKSEDFSMDFSYDYDESDSENESICKERESLMKASSKSDLGFGTMSSGSTIDCREPEIII